MNRIVAPFRFPLLRRTALSVGLAMAFGASLNADAGSSPARPIDPAAAGRTVSERLAVYKSAFAQQRAHRLHVPAARHDRPAATVPVISCDDAGAGTLREAFAHAVSGDVIDLTQLDCSLITLTSGELATAADDLAIEGPGQSRLAIDGNGSSRIIVHSGVGTLDIEGVTLQRGTYVYDQYPIYSGQANGACVLSSGSVTIADSTIDQCSATGLSVLGGAVHSDGALTLTNSTVSGTTATATTDLLSSTVYGGALNGATVYLHGSVVDGATVSSHTTRPFGGLLGGGVFGEYGVVMIGSTVTGVHADVSAPLDAYAKGGGIGTAATVVIQDSTISDNSVTGTAGYGLYNGWTYQSAIGGGGLYIVSGPQTYMPSSITNSTISGNSANCTGAQPCANTIGGGGGAGLSNSAKYAVDITNSTVSGNSSNLGGGGIMVSRHGSLVLSNSTITDNSAPDGSGIADVGDSTAAGITTDSSIIAGNHLTGGAEGSEIVTTHTLNGSHNLITSANTDLPPDTIVADPLLAPLADNGGPTQTHALLPGSAAIDAGDNASNLATDQRGDGHARVVGAATDIGAFEVQASSADDVIFLDGFES